MPAYVLIDADVTDPVRYKEYLGLGDVAMAKAGGRFLARGGAITHLEGDWHPTRLVVVEFPDRATAERWYASPEYKSARKARKGAARFRAVVVDGLPG
ncbi:MAG: DUF1330 domain-containing protein [Thermoplasmatota archaeon]|nr:DUF1330 domain-containing protein [Halobacteriales archaeon]